MQKEQKTYTKEFKVEAVQLLESSQKSQAKTRGRAGGGRQHPLPVA
jgi:transposase-like protein